jgi:hypothetical protein
MVHRAGVHVAGARAVSGGQGGALQGALKIPGAPVVWKVTRHNMQLPFQWHPASIVLCAIWDSGACGLSGLAGKAEVQTLFRGAPRPSTARASLFRPCGCRALRVAPSYSQDVCVFESDAYGTVLLLDGGSVVRGAAGRHPAAARIRCRAETWCRRSSCACTAAASPPS